MKNIYRIAVGVMVAFSCLLSSTAFSQRNVVSNISPAKNANLLFIQVANGGEFTPKAGETNTYTLQH